MFLCISIICNFLLNSVPSYEHTICLAFLLLMDTQHSSYHSSIYYDKWFLSVFPNEIVVPMITEYRNSVEIMVGSPSLNLYLADNSCSLNLCFWIRRYEKESQLEISLNDRRERKENAISFTHNTSDTVCMVCPQQVILQFLVGTDWLFYNLTQFLLWLPEVSTDLTGKGLNPTRLSFQHNRKSQVVTCTYDQPVINCGFLWIPPSSLIIC